MYTGHRKMAADTRINATAMKNLEPGERERGRSETKA